MFGLKPVLLSSDYQVVAKKMLRGDLQNCLQKFSDEV